MLRLRGQLALMETRNDLAVTIQRGVGNKEIAKGAPFRESDQGVASPSAA
jgi:hypothetical protein